MCCHNNCNTNSRCGCRHIPCCCPVCVCCPPPMPEQVMLGGIVYGTDGMPVSGMTIRFSNSFSGSVMTDINGQYTILLPFSQTEALLTITPELGLGVMATPANYVVSTLESRNDLNFFLSVI